ncbi:hypothetical protein M0R45_023454 [Rubus argutus]|uniref:Uncharacterized protein n=1 Tax=Rubus argutus TaxID=59490 RepID=A0AAW1WNH8_RUBAR
MATTSQTLPNYQPAAGESSSSNPIPEAVLISSSGSIAPFFAVVSVLTVLAFLSCMLGRILTRQDQVALTPVGSVRDRISCSLAWLKSKCRLWCVSADHCHPDVEVGSAKVPVKGFGQDRNDIIAKAKQGDEVTAPPQA